MYFHLTATLFQNRTCYLGKKSKFMATLCCSGGACGGGGATGSDFLLSGHDEITRHLVEKIDNCISDAFNVCRIEMQVYESTAAEFCEVS